MNVMQDMPCAGEFCTQTDAPNICLAANTHIGLKQEMMQQDTSCAGQ